MQVSIPVQTQYFISSDEVYKKYGYQKGHVILQGLHSKMNSLDKNKIRYVNRKLFYDNKKEFKQSSGFLCSDKKAVKDLLGE